MAGNKAKCVCGSDLHIVESGYMRYQIKHDGTQGYMFTGQPDGKESFLICSAVKCNKQYELKRLDNGQVIRGAHIQRL